MDLEIKTEKELAMLMFGITLGHTPKLELWHEETTDKEVIFGDFGGFALVVQRDGKTIANYFDYPEKVSALAIEGAYAEACRESSQAFRKWQKAKLKEQRKADRKKKAEAKRAAKKGAAVVQIKGGAA